MKKMQNPPLFRQSGVSLIEVLVVFLVLGIGLLGMAALQMKSIQYNQSAYVRSQASVAAYDILDRMRLNKTAATGGSYNTTVGTAAPSGTALYQTDLQDWKSFLSTNLPGGDGSITCSTTACTVTISWTERVNSACGTTCNGNNSLTVASQL